MELYQRIRFLRDFPPTRIFGPLWRAGEETTGRRVSRLYSEPGWIVRYTPTDSDDWFAREGEDAELSDPAEAADELLATDVDLAESIGLEF
ncbi:MAG TPA: hypothetical protein VNM91_03805 [Dehalococcoidia bacterium]|nr:hypothetical protein [Dehalococcoidia bacterium]